MKCRFSQTQMKIPGSMPQVTDTGSSHLLHTTRNHLYKDCRLGLTCTHFRVQVEIIENTTVTKTE
jgi:hypothetical protein